MVFSMKTYSMKNKLTNIQDKKLSYLKQRLAETSRAISYIIEDPSSRILDDITGHILFLDKPTLSYLIMFSPIDYSVFICNVFKTRITAIHIGGSSSPVTLELQLGGTMVNVSYHVLVAGLAYLFLPEIKETYNKGNVKVIGDQKFKDFLNIVIDYGEELSSYSRLSVEKLFREKPFPCNVVVAREYPGANFIGLKYIPTGTIYLVTFDSRFSKIAEIEILEEEKEDETKVIFGIPYELVKTFPGFIEVLDTVEKAPKIIRDYREAVGKAYLGVKAFET